MRRRSLPLVEDCTDCGVCCLAQEALPVGYYLGVLAGTDEASKLPPELLEELKVMMEVFNATRWPQNEPCVWYDRATKKCKHYEYRPDVCREAVKVNDEHCHRWRRKYGLEPNGARRLMNGRIVPA